MKAKSRPMVKVPSDAPTIAVEDELSPLTRTKPIDPAEAPALGPPNPYFEEARKQFANFEVEGVIPKLEFALAVHGVTPEQKIEIYKLMALTYAAYDDTPNATQALGKLILIKPDYVLPAASSPKMRTLFAGAFKAYRATQAVKLQHETPTAVGGAGTTTTANVAITSGAARVKTMTLHYRSKGKVGEGGYSQVPMVGGENDNFSVNVPNIFEGPEGERMIEYFIRAHDASGGLLVALGDEPMPLTMKIETVKPATPLYKNPVIWVAAAVVVGASIAAPFALRRDAHAPSGTLGLETTP